MKWLFIFLLIVNLALFGWMYYKESGPQKREVVAASGEAKGLRLLSEVRREQEAEAEAARRKEEAARAAREAEAAKEAEIAQQPEPEPQPPEEPPATTAEADDREPEFVLGPLPTDPPRSADQNASRCGTLGPIGDRKTAEGAKTMLTQADMQASLEEKSEQTRIGYWVVIPPLESAEQVAQKIQELADAGITDIWHFRSGELKNAISLGMFSQEENARNYSKMAKSKGFDTELRPRYMNKKEYTVRFRIDKSEPVIMEMWRQIELQYPNYELKKTACE